MEENNFLNFSSLFSVFIPVYRICYGSIDKIFSKAPSCILNNITEVENKNFFENKFYITLYISDPEYNIFRLKLYYFRCVFKFMFTQKIRKTKLIAF